MISMNKIVEVIKEGEIVRMPLEQAREEDLFVLRNVIESGEFIDYSEVQKIERKAPAVRPVSHLERWRSGSSDYKKNDVVKDLIPNFNWHISKARRSKGFSRPKLASMIDATEEDMKMIEMGNLPKDDFVLINRIEEKLGIVLRKNTQEKVNLAELQKANEEKFKKEPEVNSSSGKESGLFGDDIEIIE